MKQVEELKRKIREAEEEKEEIRRRRKEARGGEYMMRESDAGGIASRPMGSGVHVEQQGTEHNNNRQFYFPNKQQQHGGHRRHHQWSEGWNGQLPSHGGGQTRRQPHQQQLLQPHHSFHHASPKCGIGGHLIVALTLLGGTKRNRHPRPALRWAACTSASGAEDLDIWLRSVPLHSGLKVLAIAVVSMATATTTASPTSTTHTLMLRSLAIQVALAGGAAEICHAPGSNNSSSP